MSRENSRVNTWLAVLRAIGGLAGIGLLAYGAWLHYPPLGFMVGGGLLAFDGIFSGLRAKR